MSFIEVSDLCVNCKHCFVTDDEKWFCMLLRKRVRYDFSCKHFDDAYAEDKEK